MLRIGLIASVCISALAAGAFAQTPTFEKDVLPIFKARCLECHADKAKSGLDLRTHEGLLKGGRSGPAYVPGSLKNSLLWVNLSTDKMPANEKKLSEEEKEVVRRWIVAEGKNSRAGRTRIVVKTGPKRGVAALTTLIDADIEAGLAKQKASLSPQTDDAEFLRRVYVDLTGRIPTVEQARAFLNSTQPDRRAKLVDELLESPYYARQFAGTWARIITAEEPYLRRELEQWLTDQFQKNRPWDALVADLVTASGKGPETAFVMSNVDNKVPQPEKLTGSTARLFLGIQLQCAECHNHPFTTWKQTDFWGVAAFYTQTGIKDKKQPLIVQEAPPPPPKGKPKVEVKGAEIIIPTSAGRAAGKVVAAKFLGGVDPGLGETGPFRPVLAKWITAAENPYFAPAAVNRLWAHLFGTGLVNPIDDMHEDNPPSHPDVLDALAGEFRAAQFDLKHLIRIMCASKTYQRGSRKPADGRDDDIPYARMKLKVMSAEALYDSLILATELKEIKIQTTAVSTSGTGSGKRTESAREKFLSFFNTRDNDSYVTDFTHGIPQALSLMNDPVFNRGSPLVDKLAKLAPEQALETLFLATLSRRPSEEEIHRTKDFLSRRPEAAQGYLDLQWILLNSPEFMLIR